MPMTNYIVFPETASWEVARGCISFPAEVDGRRIKCVVAAETLKKIGAACTNAADPVKAFQTFQAQARDTAKRLLMKGRGIATGQLLLKPEDFAGN